MTKSINISWFHAALSQLCTQDKACWDLMIPLGGINYTSMFKLKSKCINTPTHPHTNVVLISVWLLLIQQANRRLCVLSEKSVYTASDLWRCCMQPKQRLWPLFPQFSPPLSVSRCWIEIFVFFTVGAIAIDLCVSHNILCIPPHKPESFDGFKTVY